MANIMYQQQGRQGPQGYQVQNPLLRTNSPNIYYTPAPPAPVPPAPVTSTAPSQYPYCSPQNEAYTRPPPPPQPTQRPPLSQSQYSGGTRVWTLWQGLPPSGKQTVDVLNKGEVRVALDNLKRSRLDPTTAAQQRILLKKRLAQLEAEAE